jgi:predicted TIM-barrel fold metal-dependent hydrolase
VIIDCHTHLKSPGCDYDPAEVEACRRLAARAGIDRVIYLFNLADTGGYDPSPDDVRRSNDLGMRVVTEHPDFFTGFCYLNPAHDPDWSLAEIERCVVHGPLSGIKLWVSVRADDARLEPIMVRAAALGIPVLHHAWYKATGYAYNESNPAQIAGLARRHPEVPIIMAHLGGGGWRGVQDVKGCPNVVVDTSGAQPQAGLVEYAVRELGAGRVVFGSDWPIRDFATQKARVAGANLAPCEIDAILGGNVARLLRLDQETRRDA